MKTSASLFSLLTVFSMAFASSAQANAATSEIGFNRTIRPILSDRCFSCHGPDSAKRKADMRLDRANDALSPLPDDPALTAFVPGHPERSEAYRRITSAKSDDVMPPAKSHLKLEAREKELIRQWIEQGAKWEEHWAFIAPVAADPPAVKDPAWPRNPVDRFVLANLESQGLRPSPRADKATLIRRVSLDLTGLPPTLAEVDAFLADSSPDAYEKVVDRLLASAHYGEQMAVTWLDYARYADSHGYQSDPERHMWRWRDWVINAYNKNMPFDQFTIEQLAGDLLPNPTTDQLIATGFNRNHRINDEGGIIAEEWRIEGVIDRVEATSAVWLGLTMGCCRCHDHKFDPITQKEFYSFAGFFNSVHEVGVGDTGATDRGINVPPVLKLPTPEQKKALAELTAEFDSRTAQVKELDSHVPDFAEKWGRKTAERDAVAGFVARFPLNGTIEGQDADGKAISTEFQGSGEPKFADGFVGKAIDLGAKDAAISAGEAVSFDGHSPFSYGAWVNIRGRAGGGTVFSKMAGDPSYRGFDLRVQNGVVEAHLIHQWPDNAIKVVTTEQLLRDKWVHLMVTYDGSEKADGVKVYVNGQIQVVKKEKDHLSDTLATPSPLLIGKRIGTEPFKGMIQDVMFFDRALASQDVADAATHPLLKPLFAGPADKLTAEHKKEIESLYRTFSPELFDANSKLASAKKALDALLAKIPDTMVMEEMPTPRDNFVLIRGQYDKHGDKVPTGLPAIFPPMPAGAPMNRLGLARWIVDPSNPLTARVQVNRLWEKFFGMGLVKTSENMGTQAAAPSNQELLDWMALELIREKWDLKAFQKLIVTSAAYQQSSDVTPDLLERDPENRLIARGPRVRLPAETIRDQALAVSDLLIDKIGGPSVKPYEPANLWEGNLYGNLGKYVQDKGEGLYRRSLYTFWKRTAPPPNLSVFDMPTREYCVIKRSRTNTPLQALDLMNDPTYLEASRVLAERMMTAGGSTPQDRIAYGFRRATTRQPSALEATILLAGFEKQLERYRADHAAASDFLHVGDAPLNPSLDVSELAAYTMTSSLILNLDEVVNKP